jgi:phosphate transport system substrate-binding protein
LSRKAPAVFPAPVRSLKLNKLPPMAMQGAQMVRSSVKTVLSMLALTGAIHAGGAAAAEVIRVQGSSTVSSRVMLPFKDAIEQKSGQKLDVVSSKSAAGLLALFEGKAEVAMTSAAIEDEAKSVLQLMPSADMGALRSFEIGRTRAALAINPKNVVRKVSAEQLQGVLSHRIVNWKELGGADLPIRIVAVRTGGGVLTTVESQVLGGKSIDNPQMIKVNNGSQVVKVVEQEEGALGIAQMSLVKAARLAELETVKPIEQRLFLVTRGQPSAAVQSMMEAARQIASKELQ